MRGSEKNGLRYPPAILEQRQERPQSAPSTERPIGKKQVAVSSDRNYYKYGEAERLLRDAGIARGSVHYTLNTKLEANIGRGKYDKTIINDFVRQKGGSIAAVTEPSSTVPAEPGPKPTPVQQPIKKEKPPKHKVSKPDANYISEVNLAAGLGIEPSQVPEALKKMGIHEYRPGVGVRRKKLEMKLLAEEYPQADYLLQELGYTDMDIAVLKVRHIPNKTFLGFRDYTHEGLKRLGINQSTLAYLKGLAGNAKSVPHTDLTDPAA